MTNRHKFGGVGGIVVSKVGQQLLVEAGKGEKEGGAGKGGNV